MCFHHINTCKCRNVSSHRVIEPAEESLESEIRCIEATDSGEPEYMFDADVSARALKYLREPRI